MSLILNIIWVVLGGWVLALEYWLGGLILCVTVVGIPFGLQCFKLGLFALWPFGKRLVDQPAGSIGKTIRLILNIVWLLTAGIWIALTHLTLAAGYAVTIIGIPFAWQHVKMIPLSLLPFGQTWVEA